MKIEVNRTKPILKVRLYVEILIFPLMMSFTNKVAVVEYASERQGLFRTFSLLSEKTINFIIDRSFSSMLVFATQFNPRKMYVVKL